MKVGIIKYNAGNVRSVGFALERLGVESIVTDNANELNSCDKIIFPGVGEASSAMKYLIELKLDVVIKDLRQPVLGICLGMQLMCDYTEEGNTACLGIFNQKVKKFVGEMKVPQVGWNTIQSVGFPKSQLFEGVNENEYLYFVHSYYVGLNEFSISETNYGFEFSSALQKNNFYATQFHPEKSGATGERILENFIKLK